MANNASYIDIDTDIRCAIVNTYDSHYIRWEINTYLSSLICTGFVPNSDKYHAVISVFLCHKIEIFHLKLKPSKAIDGMSLPNTLISWYKFSTTQSFFQHRAQAGFCFQCFLLEDLCEVGWVDAVIAFEISVNGSDISGIRTRHHIVVAQLRQSRKILDFRLFYPQVWLQIYILSHLDTVCVYTGLPLTLAISNITP